jgi:hypothetical protein
MYLMAFCNLNLVQLIKNLMELRYRVRINQYIHMQNGWHHGCLPHQHEQLVQHLWEWHQVPNANNQSQWQALAHSLFCQNRGLWVTLCKSELPPLPDNPPFYVPVVETLYKRASTHWKICLARWTLRHARTSRGQTPPWRSSGAMRSTQGRMQDFGQGGQ